MGRVVAVVAVLVALALLGPARALAQDATPAAGVGEAPDPQECRVEAPSADALIALWFQEDEAGTPVVATPEAEVATSVPAPLGEPADPETAESVTATVREVFACFNAGDFGRALALFSDDLAQQFGPEPTATVEDVRAFLEQPAEPAPEEMRIRLVAVTDVSVTDDGRVAAVVVSDDPETPPEGLETVVVYFAEEGGRWVADEIVAFSFVEEGE